MTLEEAQTKLRETLADFERAGFDAWGWDDGSIVLAEHEPRYREVFVRPVIRYTR
jgi:hypothetical protein